MDDIVFLIVSFIALIAIITMVLFISLGRKRNEKILVDLSKVLNGINSMSMSIAKNEKSATSRANALESLVFMNSQKIEDAIKQSVTKNEGRIGCMEDRIFNEIRSSSGGIQSFIQHSNTELSNTLNGRFENMGKELNELKKDLRVLKDDVLKSQTQSIARMETIVNTVRNEEHGFVDGKLQAVNREQANIGKCVQEVAKKMNNHFESIKPFEELLARLNTLYERLITLDNGILSQEKSLNGMVEKHIKIVEYTQELQKTSEEILDLMKLLMMDSIVKQPTPNQN